MEKLFQQAARFVSVGMLATGLHVSAAVGFNMLGAAPLRANFLAFLIASLFSYFGNWAWTFEAQTRVKTSAPKFMAMSLAGFAVNQSIVYWVTVVHHQSMVLAMIPVVMIIPAFSFWMSRTHIFNAKVAA